MHSVIRVLKGRRGRSTLRSSYVRHKRTENGFIVAENFLPDGRSNTRIRGSCVWPRNFRNDRTGLSQIASAFLSTMHMGLILVPRSRGLLHVIRKSTFTHPVKITRKLRRSTRYLVIEYAQHYTFITRKERFC